MPVCPLCLSRVHSPQDGSSRQRRNSDTLLPDSVDLQFSGEAGTSGDRDATVVVGSQFGSLTRASTISSFRSGAGRGASSRDAKAAAAAAKAAVTNKAAGGATKSAPAGKTSAALAASKEDDDDDDWAADFATDPIPVGKLTGGGAVLTKPPAAAAAGRPLAALGADVAKWDEVLEISSDDEDAARRPAAKASAATKALETARSGRGATSSSTGGGADKKKPVAKKAAPSKPRDLASFVEAAEDDDDFSDVAFDATKVAKRIKVRRCQIWRPRTVWGWQRLLTTRAGVRNCRAPFHRRRSARWAPSHN